jgi:hypothetical protein
MQYICCGHLSYGNLPDRFTTPSDIDEMYFLALSVWRFQHAQQELTPFTDICHGSLWSTSALCLF